MPQDSPYRWPCGGPQTFTGGCNLHNTAPELFDKFVNIATVPNPAGGSPIPPYERWTPDPSGPAGCEGHNCDTDPGSAPCAAWISAGEYNPSNPAPNTFSKSGKVDFANCHKRGDKRVHGMRQLHGTHGRLSTAWFPPSGGAQTAGVVSCVIPTLYQSATDPKRFTRVDVTMSGSDSLNSATYSGTFSSAVNALSGVLTKLLSFTQTGNGAIVYGGTPGNLPTSMVGAINFFSCASLADIISKYFVNSFSVDQDTPINTTGTNTWTTVNNTPGNYRKNIVTCDFLTTFGYETENGPDSSHVGVHIIETLTLTDMVLVWHWERHDFDTGTGVNTQNYASDLTATYSDPITDVQVRADLENNLLVLWPLNDDALYPWRTDAVVGVAPFIGRNEVPADVPIGTGGNAGDMGVRGMLIIDGSGIPSAGTFTDPNAVLYDGSIIGAPLAAGFQNFFSYSFLDYTGCCFNDGEGTQAWDLYQLGWGMNAATFNSKCGAQIPMNATLWTNFSQARNLPDGAFLFFADQFSNYFAPDCPASNDSVYFADNGGLWACKYAVILDVWPSQNFGRPGGADKFYFDETQVYCASNASGSGNGSTWNITAYDTTVPPDSTLFDGVWGGPVIGGFYSGNTYTGGVLTLGTLVYNVPSDWTSSASGLDTATCIGKLRNANAPSLLGRIGVTSSGSTYTFASPQTSFGMLVAGTETVDLFDASMSLIAIVTATRATDLMFTAAAHPTARWAMISGAPSYYFNDGDPKGDYLKLEWFSDFRSLGEATRLTGAVDCSSAPLAQPSTNVGGGPLANTFAAFTITEGCLKFNPCAPKVVCISPNGETFPNGITYPFPTGFACDEAYGSKWWGWVQATMTDVFWQTPHHPCGFVNTTSDPTESLEWLMDDGTCAPNSDPTGIGSITHIRYYAHAPQVEPRQTIPCNYGNSHAECAPDLPGGVDFGWLTPVLFSLGNVAFPPQPAPIVDDATPQAISTAYSFHKILCTTIASGGCRFNYSIPGC